MHALTSTFPTIKTITKASALALSIFTFLLAVETQAKEGFDKSSYLDLSKPYVYNGNTPRSTTRKDNQATTLLKETAGTIRNTIGSTNSDNANKLDSRITTNIKNQLKNKIVNNTETFVNDKANEFVNQFGSGRTEVKIGGLASDEIDYGIKTIQPLSKLDEKSKGLTFLQGQISSGENHGERRGTINLGVGHRLLVEDDMAIAGVNIFGDNELDSGHKRLSLGLEYQRSNFSSHINAYYPISDEKIIGKYVEEALAGHDVKLTGQVPYLPWAKAKGTYYHWDAIKGTNINGSILGMEIKLTPSINFEFGQEDSNATSSKSYGKLSVELPISDNEQFIDFAVDDKPFRASGVMDLTDLEFVERANKIRIEKTLASNAGTASLGEYNAKTVGASCTLEDSDGSTKLVITDDSGGIKLKGIEMKAGLVTLSCTGGSYIDEATGKTTNADDMRAAFIHSGRGDFTVSASPLSEIAYRLAETGAGLAADIAAKNKMVATKFGISDVNFVKTIPTELNDKRANNDNAGKFGLILAAVSQMMESDSSISINTLINYLTQDDEVLAYKLITAMNECSTGSAGADNGVACSGTGNLGAAFSATGEGSIKGNFAIALISFYDGTNTVPSIENYKDAGVTGVTIDNLAEVNAVVAKATPANSNTAAKIQTLVNSAAGEPSVAASTLSASPTTVVADGKALSTITLQAKDKDRKNIITGGLNVTMTTTGDAILSNSIDVGDGTYTATITNTKAESVTITASIAGEDVVSTVTVSFMPGEVSLITSTLTADPTTVIADDKTKSTITLQTKDAHGNNLVSGNLAVTWQTTGSAALHNIADANDGTYTVEIANDIVEDVTITASIAGTAVINTATVSFIPGEASLTTSTLTADPTTVTADGKTKSTITLQIKDVHDNDLTTSNLDITMLITTGDATLSNVTDNLDGTYTATITSATTGDAVITAKIAGAVVTNTATVSFIPGEASLTTSTVTADPTTVIADGKTKSTITLQTKDAQSNNLVTGNLDVTMTATNFATLSAVTDNKDGTYTATITNTKAESVTITASIAGEDVVSTVTVSFDTGDMSLTKSTLSASPTSVVADGQTLSTISLQVKDAQGNNLVTGGLNVTMTTTGDATLGDVSDVGDGTYTATITNTKAESVTITAKIAGEVVHNTATVSFIAGEASLALTGSTLVADPTTVVADDKALSTITLQVKDAHGNNLVTGNLYVTMTVTNSATLGDITDNEDGTYTVTIASNTTGDAVITAKIAGVVVTNTATVSFIPGEASLTTSTLVADPATVIADGKTKSTITLQTKDAQSNNLVSGNLAVTWETTGSTKISNLIDIGDGTYTVDITNDIVEDVTITAKIAGEVVTNTATISFIATIGDVSVATSTLVADPTTIVADGKTQSSITLQAKDADGENLTTTGLAVTMTASNSAKLSTPVTDNLDGTYTATITSTTAGDAVITAKIAGAVVTNTATVSFIPGEASLTTSTVTADPTTVRANNYATSTITLQTKDAQGNNLVTGGLAVTWETTGSATLNNMADAGDGTYTAEIINTKAEDVTITVSINTVAVDNTATVRFKPGLMSMIKTTLSASPTNVVADGKEKSTITLQVKDAHGNNLATSDLAVTMVITTGDATLSTPVIDNLDGTYTAEITSTTTGDVIITASIAGVEVSNTATVRFTATIGDVSLTKSTIIASPTTILADGKAKSTITLQIKDWSNSDLNYSNFDVRMTTDSSAIISDIIDNNDGSYTATVTSTKAEEAIITASIAGGEIANTATVNFIPGDIDLRTTILIASPTTVPADDETTSTITLQTKDAHGNNLITGDLDVTMVMTNGDATLSDVTDNLDGTYTATITSTTVGDVTITAKIAGAVVTNAVTVSFTLVIGEASVITSTLTASPTMLVADGIEYSTITLQTKDAHGNNLITGDLSVTMIATAPATLSAVTDHNDGTYSATITSIVTILDVTTITASIDEVKVVDTAEVIFTQAAASPATSILTTDPTTVLADGKEKSTITLQTKNAQGRNVDWGGLDIRMTTDSSATISAVTDNNDGTYTATITNTKAETAIITASISRAEVIDKAGVMFVTLATTSTLTAYRIKAINPDEINVLANGVMFSTIILQTKDVQGNNLVTSGLDVKMTTTGAAKMSAVTDNQDGTYSATITNTKPEEVIITASIAGEEVDNTTKVNFVIGYISYTKSTIIASPTTILADGKAKSTITLQIKDWSNSDLNYSNFDVRMTTDSSAIISDIIDNNDGSYTATVTSTKAEEAIITASIAGGEIANTATVNFIPGDIDLRTTILIASPTTVPADDETTSTITLQTKDAHGNNLITGDLDVTMVMTNGDATLSDVTDNLDGTYTATITSTTVGDVTITAKIAGAVVTNAVTVSFTLVIGEASVITSTLTASPTMLVADGIEYSTITLQTKDAHGNNLITGDLSVTMIATAPATLSAVTDHNDGTYSATITSIVTILDVTTITASIDEVKVVDTAEVIFTQAAASPATSILTTDPTTVLADGKEKSTITLQTKNAQGRNVDWGGLDIRMTTDSSATISAVTDNNDGTYTATITNTKAETAIITASISRAEVIDKAGVIFATTIIDASLTASTLSVDSAIVVADGNAKSTITLQAKSVNGDNLVTDGLTVTMETTGSAKISEVIDNHNGTYSATITSIEIGEVVITANIAGEKINDTAKVNFIIGVASATISTLTASSTTVIADGNAESIITLQTKDAHGNNLITGDLDVTIVVTNGDATISDVTDNHNGTYTATIISTTTGDVTITAKIDTVVVVNTAEVSFTIGDISVTKSTLTASSTTVIANGETTSTITLQVKDVNSNNLDYSNFVVSMTTDSSAIISDIIDNNDGSYTATVTSTKAEEAIITASIAGEEVTNTATVSFTPGEASVETSTLSADPTTVLADGVTKSTITLQTKDINGNNLVTHNVVVTWEVTGFAKISAIKYNNNATYSVTITNTRVEDVIITAKINAVVVANIATVVFVPTIGDASVTTSTLTADPITVVADGLAKSTITLQGKDVNGNNLVIGDLAVTWQTTGSAKLGDVIDNEDGTYTAEITNTKAETVTVTARIAGVEVVDTATVDFSIGEVSLKVSTLTATPITALADGNAESIITLQTKDAQGNNLITGGLEVAIVATTSDATISDVIDNNDGTYTATIANTKAETVIITASIAGEDVYDTATMSFTMGEVSPTTSYLSVIIPAYDGTLSANGIEKGYLRLHVKDVNGNRLVVADGSVAMRATGSAKISPIFLNNSNVYIATITNNKIEDVVVTASVYGVDIINTVGVSFTIGAVSVKTSTLSADPITVVADGIESSTITLQTKDANGNNIVDNNAVVTMETTGSATISKVVYSDNGTYTATITNIKAETVTITANASGVAIINTVAMSFIPDDASAVDSTLIASPITILADDIEYSTITLQTKDVNGNNLITGGLVVKMTTDSLYATISAVTDNNDGTYTATITNTKAETAIITASIAGVEVSNTATVSFTAGEASLTTSTLTAYRIKAINPDEINVLANGVMFSTIILQTKDVQGNNLVTSGLDVKMTTTGAAKMSAVTDNQDGTYSATITNTKPEEVIITASIAGEEVDNTTKVNFVIGYISYTKSTIIASPTTILADGKAKSTITLQIKDWSNSDLNYSNFDVRMTTDSSAIISDIIDNNDGSYTATVTSTKAEEAIITASIAGGEIANTATVNFIPGDIDLRTTILIASPTTVPADDETTSTITLQTKDAHGNNLITGDLDVTMVMTNGDATLSDVTDNLDGTYTATITSTTVGDVTITAKIAGAVVTNAVTVSFTLVIGEASVITSTLTASPTMLVADGIEYSTITLQTKDAHGNNLITGDLSVTMIATAPATLSAVTDHNDGTYSATITSIVTILDVTTITASIDEVKVVDTAEVIFTQAAASPATSILTTDPTTVLADGKEKSTITLQTKNAQGRNVDWGGLDIRMTTDSSATISAVTDNNDGTYTATITNTKAETAIITASISRAEVIDKAGVIFATTIIDASLTASTLSVDSAIVVADGNAKSTITLQAKSVNGDNLVTDGLTVTMETTGSAKISEVIDNHNGTYSATITSIEIGEVVITANIAGEKINDTAKVNFIIGVASATISTLTASSTTVIADGNAESIITLQTKDAHGNNLITGDLDVTIVVTNGDATISDVTDNHNGTYTATIISTTTGDVTITAKIDTVVVVNTAEVSFTIGDISVTKSTLTASSTTVIANGETTSTITLQVKDVNSNNLDYSNFVVSMTTDSSAIISDIIDNNDGSYTATVTSTKAEEAIITASIAGEEVTNTATVSFTPGEASVETSTLSADPTTVLADGVTKSTITLQTKDINGNNLITGDLDVTIVVTTGDATIGDVTDHRNGTYSAAITSTIAGDVTITAKIDTVVVANTVEVSFTIGNASVTRSTLSVYPMSIVANGVAKSTITLQIKDEDGDNMIIHGLDIDMIQTGDATIGNITNAGGGTYTADITSTSVDNIIITASIAGKYVINKAPMLFTVLLDTSVATSTLTAFPMSVVANGVVKSTITLQTKDENGHNIVTGGLAVGMTADSLYATISDVIDNNDGTYTAAITNNTVEDVIITASIAGEDVNNTITVSFTTIPDGSVTTSMLTAYPIIATANGVAKSTITLQTKDENGHNIVNSDLAVMITIDSLYAAISNVINNNDGTYTATITNTKAEDVTVTANFSGVAVINTAMVRFIPGDASLTTSTLTADPINVAANGVTKSTITLQVKDAYGNDLTTSGLAVNMETTGSATISKVVYSGNGTYTATITNTKIENVVITANIVYIFDKEYVVNTAMVSFKTAVSTQKSTLRLPKQNYVVSEIAEKFSSVIFESRNSDGDLIDVTNMADLLDVVMETTGSAILGEVTYIGGGFYEASISNTKAETVTVSVKIYGLDVVNTINVAFVPGVVDPDRSFMYEGESERWEIYKWIHLQMRDKYDNDVIDTSGLEVTFKSSSDSEHFGELRIIEESKVYGNFGKRFTSTYKMEVFSRAYINGEPTGASIRFSIGNAI